MGDHLVSIVDSSEEPSPKENSFPPFEVVSNQGDIYFGSKKYCIGNSDHFYQGHNYARRHDVIKFLLKKEEQDIDVNNAGVELRLKDPLVEFKVLSEIINEYSKVYQMTCIKRKATFKRKDAKD